MCLSPVMLSPPCSHLSSGLPNSLHGVKDVESLYNCREFYPRGSSPPEVCLHCWSPLRLTGAPTPLPKAKCLSPFRWVS